MAFRAKPPGCKKCKLLANQLKDKDQPLLILSHGNAGTITKRISGNYVKTAEHL